ncbi:hypothetical protein [Hafnia alvei]|uniref:hypothetical protein n=1 Tax=Hafnia alvei TaxID=569 RepID=UPI00061D245A|nr:hypothetical protein [Hafnia alvei]KKF38388.1 hypothetical protein PU01_23690 [Hafnia alvei]MBW3477275.1 hypothetical protein [Hafnia alvei]
MLPLFGLNKDLKENKMASKYELEILGDNSKFNKTVNDSMKKLDELSAHTGGFMNGISGSAGKATGALNALTGMSPGLAALGIAGAGAGLALAWINKTSDYVNGLNQLSKATGVSVENLQKLKTEFKDTGMAADEFGNINTDALDHIGDSIRGGGKGGIADDLKEWGISMKDFTQYTGDAEGGIKATIALFYKMKAAGASQAETVNAMESMASGSSKMISNLSQYSNEVEALSAIQSHHAGVTNDTAREYEAFQGNIDTLNEHIQTLSVQAIAPLVVELNELWDFFNRDWNKTDFYSVLTSMQGMSGFGGATNMLRKKMAGYTRPQDQIDKENYDKQVAAFLAKSKQDGDKAYNIRVAESAALKKINEQEAKDAKTEADKASKLREQEAAKAAAAHAKMLAERKQAFETLSKLNTSLISGAGQGIATSNQQIYASMSSLQGLLDKGYISLEQFNEKRSALLEANKTSFAKTLLGVDDPQELSELLDSVNTVYEMANADLKSRFDNNLMTQQEYAAQSKAILDQFNAQKEAISSMSGELLLSQQSSRLGFANSDDEQAIAEAQLNQQMISEQAVIKSAYDLGVINHKQFLDRKALLDTQYAAKQKQLTMATATAQLQQYSQLFGGMSQMIASFGGENNKAIQGMFMASQAFSIAKATMDGYTAINAAWASGPFPANLGAVAMATGQVFQNISAIKSQSLTGMAHDGISEVPTEGTWLLNKGERVVDDRTNGDLKDFLSEKKTGQEAPVTVNAPMNIQGSVRSDDAAVMNAIKKHPQLVAQAVQDAQRRNM